MPIVAVVDATTRKVQSCIVASLDDKPYPGTLFVVVEADEAKGSPVDGRFELNEATGRVVPNAVYQARLDANRAEDERREREEERARSGER